MAATLGSTVLGFIREVINARYYGTQWEMDTFLAAATIPTILFGLFNGALVSALVPTFSEYLARGQEEEAWSLASTIFNLLLIVLSLGAVAGWVLAPWYVPLIAHGFPPPQMGIAVRMTRWLMPSIVATSLAGVVAAMLNAHHRFRSAAIQGMAINLVTIACIVAFNARMGIYALVLGTTLGLVAQLAVQMPAFLLMRKYRLSLDLHHPGLQRIWMMLGPIIVGSAAGQIALFFDRFFASTLPPGYMAGMNYATKLVGFPQQIFAAAIATVIFPLLASQFASRNRSGVRRSVVTGLRLVNFITIPSVAGLVVLAGPIVQVLFQRGAFRDSATALCASLVPYAACGLLAVAANVVLTRCCFACKETRWTVVISVASVALNVVLSMLWLPTLGARGLLLANSVSQQVQMFCLLALVWRLVHGLDIGAILRSALGVGVSTAAMLGAITWIHTLGVAPGNTFAMQAWYLLGQLAIASAVYVAAARLTRVEELNLIVSLIVQKYKQHLPSPPENRSVPIA